MCDLNESWHSSQLQQNHFHDYIQLHTYSPVQSNITALTPTIDWCLSYIMILQLLNNQSGIYMLVHGLLKTLFGGGEKKNGK